jgi:Protein of unknown function (DUF3152)
VVRSAISVAVLAVGAAVGTVAPLGASALGRALGPNETRTVSLAGAVPPGARAVVVNITAVDASRSTFLTVFEGGAERPLASTVNPAPGVTTHNVTFVALSDDDTIDIYNDAGSVEVLVDVLAWSADPLALGEPVPLAPTRLFDTRGTGAPVRGVRRVAVAGRAGVPSRVGAVLVNVTALNASTRSFITVSPSGAVRPNLSNLNPQPGEVRHNLVVTPLGTDGSIDVYNDSGTVDVFADVVGWIPARAIETTGARRLLDTRADAKGAMTSGSTRTIAVPAAAGRLAVVNVTSTGSTGDSFVTMWPTGVPRPLASNLNPRRDANVHNMAMVPVGSDGTISLYHDVGSSHLIVDLLSIVSQGLRPITPRRVLDTRQANNARSYTYRVRSLGAIGADLKVFRERVAQTLADTRGWAAGDVMFREVPDNADFTIWLAEPAKVPTFGKPCSVTYSCRVGNDVIINDDRWRLSSAAWLAAGLPLRDYEHMVVNHEVGHWLGFGHSLCSGPGRLAPVMQQQSISLSGCTFNPWPLPSERTNIPRNALVSDASSE